MFSAALRRNIRNRSFENLQKRLLNALAAYVARNRRVFAFSCDFVYFVDINYSALCLLDVIVRRLNKTEKNVFDILADISCLGERGCVSDRKRHVESFGKRLCKERFSYACGAEKQNVALYKLHIDAVPAVDSFVMIIYRYAQCYLCLVLTDDILVELRFYLLRLRKHARRRCAAVALSAFRRFSALDYTAAVFDAFVADIGVRTLNQH